MALVILYVVLVSAFFGWSMFHRTGERGTSEYGMEPLLTDGDESEVNYVNFQKNETQVLQFYVLCTNNYFYFLSSAMVKSVVQHYGLINQYYVRSIGGLVVELLIGDR